MPTLAPRNRPSLESLDDLRDRFPRQVRRSLVSILTTGVLLSKLRAEAISTLKEMNILP